MTWRLAGSVDTSSWLLDAQIAAVVANALQHGQASAASIIFTRG